MRINKSPAFQFYPNDILNDEVVKLMDNREFGAYVKLLCFNWLEGSIPATMDELARLADEPQLEFEKIWSKVGKKFHEKRGSERLTNPRMERERQKQRLFAKRCSENAKKRWDSANVVGAKPLPRHKPSVCSSSPSSSSSPISGLKTYSGDHQEVVAHLLESFKAKKGASYPFNGMDGRVVKSLLGYYEVAQIKALWDCFLACDDDWIRKVGHKIGEFRRQIPMLLDKSDYKAKQAKYEQTEIRGEGVMPSITFKTSRGV